MAAPMTIRNGKMTVQNGILTIRTPRAATASGGSGFTIVQSTGNACASNICSSTFNATVTTGNLIIIGYQSSGENLDVTDIADKAANVYTSTAASAGSNSESLMCYKLNATGGSSFWVNAHVATPGGGVSMVVWEISGVTALDTANGFTQTSGTPATQAMATTASGGIVAVLSYEGGATTIAPGVTYTQDFEQESSAIYVPINGEHKSTTAGSNTADWTLGTSKVARMSAAAFK